MKPTALAAQTLSNLLQARPSAIETLSLEGGADGKLMLYYGIDPQSINESPERMSAVLEFLERASRDIEQAAGLAPTCVAVAV
jgi:hypothetical protein